MVSGGEDRSAKTIEKVVDSRQWRRVSGQQSMVGGDNGDRDSSLWQAALTKTIDRESS